MQKYPYNCSTFKGMERRTCEVIIVDDHQIFRKGLKLLIDKLKWVKVVGEAENGVVLRKLLLYQQPDIIIMDVNMPMGDGISATGFLNENYPAVKVIAMTVYNDSYTIKKMLEAGASGYLTKDVKKEELELALKKVFAGKTYIKKEAEQVYEKDMQIIRSMSNGQPSSPISIEMFTTRELEILKMIASGKSNKEIGLLLNISFRTVEKHRGQMLKKMKVNNIHELLYKLSKYNLL